VLGTRLFVCAVVAIFVSACGTGSYRDRGIKPLLGETILAVANTNLYEAVVYLASDPYCRESGLKKIGRVRSGEERSFRVRAMDFGSAGFAIQVRLDNPARTKGCIGVSGSPFPGSTVIFEVPLNLSQLTTPMIVPPR